MNNEKKYKETIDNIHAPEDLKRKTFEKMKSKSEKKINFIGFKMFPAVAVFLIVFAVGYKYFDKGNIVYTGDLNKEKTDTQVEELPRFKNIEELKSILKENANTRNTMIESYAMNAEDSVALESTQTEGTIVAKNATVSTTDNMDYSKTNNQVESVDEADIVKTDGKFVYYLSSGIVNIIDAESLELLAEIKGWQTDQDSEYESFTPNNIFLNGNKMIIIGSYYKSTPSSEHVEGGLVRDYVYINYASMTKALVYDISDKRNPEMIRDATLDGYYKDARMIGDNVYFITNKGINYYWTDDIKEEDILPIYYDSIEGTEEKMIQCTRIAYFPHSENRGYTLIGGFNVNNNEPLMVETIFGAGDTIYCSENNLYLTQTIFDKESYARNNVKIYKFELDNSKVTIKAEGEVEGYINNQFSLDEYDGNLRIATTVITKPWSYNEKTEEYTEEETTNRVYILDEDLNEISRIDNMAFGERIYAVRFIGKVGYVVTFEQVDPLFVLDLSDPRNPEIKGELKIPGYSSYLHPYDDNHIIGIGYNTKDNGYGGVRNSNLKMSMFDISDLSNPVEMFNISVGLDYAYSEIAYNHKGLFYKASDNLIGFSYNTYDEDYSNEYYAFEIFHIDLENGFEEFAKFNQNDNYQETIRRMIYIGNTIYGLSEVKVTSYDLNTQELLHELELSSIYDVYEEEHEIDDDEENIIYIDPDDVPSSDEEEIFPEDSMSPTITITDTNDEDNEYSDFTEYNNSIEIKVSN